MPFDRVILALHAIRESARLAHEFLGSASINTFKGDRRTFYAVSTCLEIVSEASRRLPTEMPARRPQLPCRKITGLGNIYRHDYDNVVESIVWRTVHEDLLALERVVELEIARHGRVAETDD